MSKPIFLSLLAAVMLHLGSFSQDFRPPAVPLVAHDPYFSIWSPSDNLYDREPVHWTGRDNALHSILRVDGKSYRVMGSHPSNLEPIKQTGVTVYPTRTVYQFKNSEVSLELVFTTPSLMNNLDVLSRPVTYINWNVKSVDGKEHDVQVYFDCSATLAVNEPEQEVGWDSPTIEGLNVLRLGTTDQPVLQKRGDDIRIDWGYVYFAIPQGQKPQLLAGRSNELIHSFISDGKVPESTNLSQPRRVREGWVSLGASWNLGKVGLTAVSTQALLAYDDIYSIKYFDANLPAWWKRNGATMEQLLPQALGEYKKLSAECAAFDTELMADMEKAGGKKYAMVNALVYRQVLAAHKLVADENGKPLLFSKENNSNGCMATVDVIYPAAPYFFLFSKELTKAMLQPVFSYAASERWKFPFAPHDLGTYPHATGQVYGGGEISEENQMPVEESANMIIMTAALAQMEGNASYAQENWAVLEKWSEYLLSKGFDPENQLCTDDFAGHLAHNINLSAKAIVALGCYAKLCDMTGSKKKAKEIRETTEGMVKKWIEQATEGDHTRLAFDRPGTWSQKYNLVWDEILGLNLFPREVIDKEIAHYKKMQAEFGLPLDSRERYTKNDWITWTATMATTKEDFMELFNPIYHFANKTPQRVPLSDWYITDNAYMVGFKARSVVGGFYIKMIADKETWNKWLNKGTNVTGPWAPLKLVELGKEILAHSARQGYEWKYTLQFPAGDWYKPGFNDENWQTGTAGFGSLDIPFSRTHWQTNEIWVRRTFTIDELSDKKLALNIFHDEDAEVYINGELVARLYSYTTSYQKVLLDKHVKDVLKIGANTIAVHCRQTVGGQFIDVGLAEY
ncbi:MAG: DUF4965 domain-containing protein [Bacteroidales bacterium]|nr:DUF4965 domain-containing protein [Bacteroidales bacterium]